MDEQVFGACPGPALASNLVSEADKPIAEASSDSMKTQESSSLPAIANYEDSDENDENDYATPEQDASITTTPAASASNLVDTVQWALKGLGVRADVATSSEKTPAPFLLNLPVEVLQAIVLEIRSTNDLTALALTHSALHAIVVPQLYSRFDIVWPDPTEEDDLSTGVDALAYGLGTLAMSGNILGPKTLQCSKCEQCGHVQSPRSDTMVGSQISRRVVHNYAQFTRKFSLGNGPSKFVQSYYMSTESGKMLGTLVALALYRMVNLESFVWDMPTGIVREVWEALSSLSYDRSGFQASDKLKSIWVRCPHSVEAKTPAQNVHLFLSAENLGARKELLVASLEHIEHPSFAILPSLRSISVLEIDEIAYFEELSILISASRQRLRDLRIGISKSSSLFNDLHRGSGSDNNGFMGESSLTPLGANGPLGMLMCKICPCYRRKVVVLGTGSANRATTSADSSETTYVPQASSRDNEASTNEAATTTVDSSVTPVHHPAAPPHTSQVDVCNTGNKRTPEDDAKQQPSHNSTQKLPLRGAKPSTNVQENDKESVKASEKSAAQEVQRLKLRELALENVPLSVCVLLSVLDFTVLTDLTLLNCRFDEDLWKTLVKAIPPLRNTSPSSVVTKAYSTLRLRKIYTDGVSMALLAFIKDGLAPNTLVDLFLQDRRDYKPSYKVSIDQIYKHALRRHRESLQKLSIDSCYKHGVANGSWKKWTINRDTLAFITSGKMSNLKELALSVDFNDWHFLLQNLPGLPQLRSLYVPNIVEQSHSTRPDARELALQVLDIITLRPEIEMCYIGIMSKCFEILEGKDEETRQSPDPLPTPGAPQPAIADGWNNVPFLNHEESEDSSVSSEDDEEEEEDDGDEDSDDSESTSSESSTHSSAASDAASHGSHLRLREILFFTEKVEIFKIRHGTIS